MDDLTFLTDALSGNVRININKPDGSYTSIPQLNLVLLSQKCPALVNEFQLGPYEFTYTFENKSESAVIGFLRFLYLDDYMFYPGGLEMPCSLLTHLQIYQLGDAFRLPALKESVRDYIIDEAERFRESIMPMHGFYDGVRFLYTDLRQHLDLRRIVTYYTIMRFKHFNFARSETFRQTVYESPLFHRDLQQGNTWTDFCSDGAMDIVQLPVCNNRLHDEDLDFTCHLHSNFPEPTAPQHAQRANLDRPQALFPSAWTNDNPTWFVLGKRHCSTIWNQVVNPSPQSKHSGPPLVHWHQGTSKEPVQEEFYPADDDPNANAVRSPRIEPEAWEAGDDRLELRTSRRRFRERVRPVSTVRYVGSADDTPSPAALRSAEDSQLDLPLRHKASPAAYRNITGGGCNTIMEESASPTAFGVTGENRRHLPLKENPFNRILRVVNLPDPPEDINKNTTLKRMASLSLDDGESALSADPAPPAPSENAVDQSSSEDDLVMLPSPKRRRQSSLRVEETTTVRRASRTSRTPSDSAEAEWTFVGSDLVATVAQQTPQPSGPASHSVSDKNPLDFDWEDVTFPD